MVFAPNHQNAFLDAVLVACSSKRNPFFWLVLMFLKVRVLQSGCNACSCCRFSVSGMDLRR
ncbi:MAG: hypothetical protein IPN13_18875 [Bacteroidetes bacterium]|nr:hypothetical protein [Bacteroidota bacterium]